VPPPPTKPPAAAQPSEALVAGEFWVDISRPLPGAGGGLPAFAVIDRRDGQAGLMAVQVRRHLPARPQALQSLVGAGIDGLLAPLAYGAAPAPGGEEAGFLICQAPPGPSLAAALRPWPEPELLAFVLRPAARVLDQLGRRGLTHRAIRADNVFRAGPGHPIVLGCAWATPPAALQPALAEPPYVSVCLPSRRGDGTIADDVYALGVLMLVLALGRAPLAGVAEAEITHQKLDQGSYTTLIGDHRPGSFVADLLRGMLAEDPEHRPPPSLLLDPAAARSRRIASRPPTRAPHPIQVGDQVCWHPRTLAHALATQPGPGLQALKSSAVGQWLRRGLGDGALAVRLEERLGFHAGGAGDDTPDAEALSLMRAVEMLDPLAPMCWDGLILWPDAIGTSLAAMQDPAVLTNANQTGVKQPGANQPGTNQTGANQTGANLTGANLTGGEQASRIARLVAAEAHVAWAGLRPDRPEMRLLRQDARQLRALLQLSGPSGGVLRLTYQLNPLLPCTSPGLELRWVARLADLMPALEAAARRDRAQASLITPAVAAFIAARGDRALETAVARLADIPGAVDPLAQLRLLAQLQARYHPKPLPALGAWVTERTDALLTGWHSRPRRALLRPRLGELATSGELATLVALLDDSQARRTDERERQLAARNLGWIDATLEGIATGGPVRAERARRLGQEVAAGIGLTALAMLLLIAALG
jgi:hypothetical protein